MITATTVTIILILISGRLLPQPVPSPAGALPQGAQLLPRGLAGGII